MTLLIEFLHGVRCMKVILSEGHLKMVGRYPELLKWEMSSKCKKLADLKLSRELSLLIYYFLDF